SFTGTGLETDGIGMSTKHGWETKPTENGYSVSTWPIRCQTANRWQSRRKKRTDTNFPDRRALAILRRGGYTEEQ
ncbi:MAG TPA: hypothetical protein VH682_22270, partial [Gemmataceae bacterium]